MTPSDPVELVLGTLAVVGLLMGTKAVFVGPTATQACENLSARENHRECR